MKKYVDSNLIDLQKQYQIFPNYGTLNCSNTDFYNPNKFAIVKLNGNAIFETLAYDSGTKCPYDETHRLNVHRINKFLELYEKLFPSNNLKDADAFKYFNYSWETSSRFSDKYLGYYCNRDIALAIARQTEVLVIVGYSFPFFNRGLDLSLLNEMPLKKLIIQDYNADEIKNRLVQEIPRIREFAYANRSQVLLTQPSKYFPTPSELEVENKVEIPGWN